MRRDQESEAYLAAELAHCNFVGMIEVWDTVSSTNDRMRTLAAQHAPEGTLVLASSQTAGRGRMGRRFVSPNNAGLYMSLLLRPNNAAANPGLITACAAVAMWQAIQNLTNIAADIKWVNDLYFCQKKLCGILAEGQFDAEGRLASVVLGVGVNLQKPAEGYDADIADIVTSVAEMAPDKTISALKLCREFCLYFAAIYRELPKTDFLAVYRSASCVLGRRVTYQKNGRTEQGLAVEIDDSAHLVVQKTDGARDVLEAGEISLLRTTS